MFVLVARNRLNIIQLKSNSFHPNTNHARQQKVSSCRAVETTGEEQSGPFDCNFKHVHLLAFVITMVKGDDEIAALLADLEQQQYGSVSKVAPPEDLEVRNRRGTHTRGRHDSIDLLLCFL